MENVIIPNIKGGLGNQMFQIAAAIGIAEKNNLQYAINYNLRHNCGQGFNPSKYRDNLFSNIPHTSLTPVSVYSEPFFHYQDVVLNGTTLIDGYFQSEKYFSHCNEIVRNIFKFREEEIKSWETIKQQIDVSNTVIIHLRRGDYVNYPTIHPILDNEYYKKALTYIFSKNKDITSIIVCTDDWKSVKSDGIISEVITPFKIPVGVTEGCNELQDLYIMSQCNHIIMSNSSLSWWGSFLGKIKTTIAPNNWFGINGPQDFFDIYNPDWKLL